MSDQFDDDLFAALPQGTDLQRYVDEGWPLNHFLTALVENDLMECIGRADDANLAALEAYCLWLKNFAPAQCFGSKERVAAWIAQRGLKGAD